MSVKISMYTKSLIPDEILFETLTDSPNVLFDQPKELNLIHLTKRSSDVNTYTITLYTNTFYISTDKRSIYFFNDKLQPDKYVSVTNDVLTLYLHDRTFIKGTVKIKTESDILNEIIDENNESKDENINEIIDNQVDIDANQSNEITEPVPYKNTSLDNLEQIKNDEPIESLQSDDKSSSDETVPNNNHCSDILTQCEQKITNEKQDLENSQNFYTDMIMKYRGVIKQKDTEFQQTTTELKQQSLRCAKELKKQINLNNENNKKINDSQSTQTTTIIIICVLIIILLLGLCIYLYFFKR